MLFIRNEVEDLLNQGVDEGAFPGAVAMWGRPDKSPETVCRGFAGLTRNHTPLTPNTVYDLASLTKVLAATSLAMLAVADGKLNLTQPLDDGPLAPALPPAALWNKLTPADLMTHQSGLVPWLAFHRLSASSPADKRRAIVELIADTPAEASPGQRTIYSDLNFILLGFLLEAIGGDSLDCQFQEKVAGPLGLTSLGYLPPASAPLAPTEDGFRWGGPLGDAQGGLKGPVPLGRPHDDNAAFLDGVAGHAGLFGAAGDIWALAAQWSKAARGKESLFKREVLMDFTRPRPSATDAGRPLGFNTITNIDSMKSITRLSQSSVGHLGYTGPSLWWDLGIDFIWLFLSNRVHPKADNPAWKPGHYQAGPSRYLVFH